MTKRIFEIEWDDDLGPMWMNKDNLLACLTTIVFCVPGLKVEDVTDKFVKKEKTNDA